MLMLENVQLQILFKEVIKPQEINYIFTKHITLSTTKSTVRLAVLWHSAAVSTVFFWCIFKLIFSICSVSGGNYTADAEIIKLKLKVNSLKNQNRQ